MQRTLLSRLVKEVTTPARKKEVSLVPTAEG